MCHQLLIFALFWKPHTHMYKDNFPSEGKRLKALLRFENETELTEEMYGLAGKCVLYDGRIEVIINV